MADATVTVTRTPQATIIKIAGELRLSVEGVQRQLDMVMVQRPKRVILDLADLGFVSSLGMGILVSFQRGIKGHDGLVFLAAVQPNVNTSLRFTRLTDLMPSFPTVAHALAAP